jgi:ABC-type amino acid transport/signal transduction systems, periplasmic component/domain
MIKTRSRKRTLRFWVLHVLAGFLCVGTIVGLSKYAPAFFQADRSLQRVVSSGVITVGYSIEAPHAFLTPEGHVTGVSPEIVRHIMGTLGVRDVRWRKCEFGELINELEAGHIDMIAAGMYITAERMQRISFSSPVFIDPPGLLVLKGNPKNITHYRQIVEDPSIRISVTLGSLEEQVYWRIGVDPARVIAMPDVPTARAAIMGGGVDAVALPISSVRRMAASDKSGRIEANDAYQGPFDDVPCTSAFACRKEDRTLLRAVSKALDAFIGTEEHLSLTSSFGFTEGNLPPRPGRRGEPHHE